MAIHRARPRVGRRRLTGAVLALSMVASMISAAEPGAEQPVPDSAMDRDEAAGAAGLGRASGGTAGIGAAPAPTPSEASSPEQPGAPVPGGSGRLGAPAPPVVRAAVDFRPLTRYGHDISGGAYTNTGNTGGHTYVLAMAARAGDTSADEALLAQLRHVLAGGNDIAANGGYPSQHELQITGPLSISKRIPRIWDQLSVPERQRADAMMAASLVGNAFTTSDRNPFVAGQTQQYTVDGDSNVDRGWNPNYREGMVGSVLVAAAYFGPQAARDILASYDHDDFVAELNSLGLSNAHRTFTYRAANPSSPAPTGAQIEQAVRDWSLRGVGLDDPMRLYADLTAHTYGATVECGYQGQGVPAADAPGGTAGVIDRGCDSLPHRGQPGMLLEFASVDAGGVRSSAVYAYGGFKPNLFTRLVLIDAGLWDPRPELAGTLDLIYTGAEDLWYKLTQGYRNYQHGRYSGTLRVDSDSYGFSFLGSLWRDVYLDAS